MKFSEIISDHVKLEWTRSFGTTSIILDDWIPLLDLTEISYNPNYNFEVAKRYVGCQLCDYLKNLLSKEDVLSDYWTNKYCDKSELLRAFETLEANIERDMEDIKKWIQ